jgi:Lon protease-like protein
MWPGTGSAQVCPRSCFQLGRPPCPARDTRLSDLSEIVPVFPLRRRVILLPRAQLPLNIFEPRYLNMIDDAMAGDRLIAMVQTAGRLGGAPDLAPVGCVGKITSFAETGDGRYLITLTGVSPGSAWPPRWPVQSPYRQCRVDFAPYRGRPHTRRGRPRRASIARAWFRPCDPLSATGASWSIDWDTAEQAPPDPLINSLSIALPFEPASRSRPCWKRSAVAGGAGRGPDGPAGRSTPPDPDDGGPSFMQ